METANLQREHLFNAFTETLPTKFWNVCEDCQRLMQAPQRIVAFIGRWFRSSCCNALRSTDASSP